MASKVDYIKVLKVNLIFVVLVFLPVLPISSYLHDLAVTFFGLIYLLFLLLILLTPVWLFFGATYLFVFMIMIFEGGYTAIKKVFGKMNTARTITFSLLANFIFSMIILISGIIQNAEQHYNIIHHGEEIVKALQYYHRDHQDYPENLAQITPRYLEKLPKKSFPIISDFHYLKQEKGFLLSFTTQYFFFTRNISYEPSSILDCGIEYYKTGVDGWVYKW